MTTPSSGQDPFALLLDVQDLDTAIQQLRHRRQTLPARAELAAAEAERRQVLADDGRLGAELERLGAAQAELEGRVGVTEQRRQAVEQRMYAARGLPARELSVMQGEAAHLAERRRELEDEELEIMEAQERLEDERAPLTRRLEAVGARMGELALAVAEGEVEIDAELGDLEQRRGVEAAQLPTALAQRYEQLRERLGGTGAARLVGDRCDGCHLTLPSMEVERIRRLAPDEIVTCEQCGRILVRS